MTAPMSSDVDVEGYISGNIQVSAENGDQSGNLSTVVKLPFAVPTSVANVVNLVSRENIFMNPRPVVLFEVLHPGDVLEVIPGVLLVRFCNGQSALIESKVGTRIVLGTGHGIDLERSSIGFWLKDQTYSVLDDPRGYVKIVLLNGISEAIANAYAPGSGSTARWIFNKAAEEGVNYTLNKVTESRAPQSALPHSASADTPSLSDQESYTVVNMFPDDKILVTPVRGWYLWMQVEPHKRSCPKEALPWATWPEATVIFPLPAPKGIPLIISGWASRHAGARPMVLRFILEPRISGLFMILLLHYGLSHQP